jgi:branched-chain amino acid transport system ATP-binding protein
MTQEVLLEIKDMHVNYGAIKAIHGIDLKVHRGEIVTILGSNGAGKTTSLHTISGLLKPSKGQILFKGQNIDGIKANKIVGMGLAHSPEGRMVFPDLTVKENLEMGAYLRSDKAEIEKDYEYMYNLFPKLKERSSQLAGTLSGGEQQMLAIARAYMSKPELLLLDEPSLGIAPILVQAIFDAIVDLNKHGMTILLVEQNAFASLKIAHRGYVLTTGEIFMEGPASELITNEEIQKAYLGH